MYEYNSRDDLSEVSSQAISLIRGSLNMEMCQS